MSEKQNPEIFKTRYDAKKRANEMVGWKIKIIKFLDGFVIQCDKNKYLRVNGFVN